jgi:hypothetical protein
MASGGKGANVKCLAEALTTFQYKYSNRQKSNDAAESLEKRLVSSIKQAVPVGDAEKIRLPEII